VASNDHPARSRGPAPEPDDPSIPVLTERLSLPTLDIDLDLPSRRVAPLPAVPPPSAAPAAATAPALAVMATPLAWDKLELALREAVLRDLSTALPQIIDQIVREKMQPGIQAALDRLAIETRVAIAGSLREIVDRAIKTRLDELRKRGG
jgi:hypothetical protein